MSFETLLPLIKKTGSDLSPAEFQHIVNVVFHDAESEHYDAMHADMWESLQQQINLLVDDLPKKTAYDLSMLDIGCGTGLSTQMLLDSALGISISKVTLLDTSPKMLGQALKRAKLWSKEVEAVNATVDSVNGVFDVIIISSVLHHIPDMAAFLAHVSRLQREGGILIHLQDPNGDYMRDADFRNRIASYVGEQKSERSSKSSWLKTIRRLISKMMGRKTYMDRVNDRLMELGAIKSPMTSEEIWSVTDIHVEDLPFSTGSGVSIKALSQLLNDYTLISSRSYGFFGPLKSSLPIKYQLIEQQLIDERAPNGRNVSAVWIRK